METTRAGRLRSANERADDFHETLIPIFLTRDGNQLFVRRSSCLYMNARYRESLFEFAEEIPSLNFPD